MMLDNGETEEEFPQLWSEKKCVVWDKFRIYYVVLF